MVGSSVRAVIDLRDTNAERAELAKQLLIDGDHLLRGRIAQPDALLVGDDRQRETGRLQRRQPFADTRHQLDVRGVIEKRDVADQRAVAVEQNEAAVRD